MAVMLPINTNDSPTAARIHLGLSCKKCGKQVSEPLTRFHGRYRIACPECLEVIDLRAPENRILIEKLVALCRSQDAALAKGKKGR
jgi:hypothetical protein